MRLRIRRRRRFSAAASPRPRCEEDVVEARFFREFLQLRVYGNLTFRAAVGGRVAEAVLDGEEVGFDGVGAEAIADG